MRTRNATPNQRHFAVIAREVDRQYDSQSSCSVGFRASNYPPYVRNSASDVRRWLWDGARACLRSLGEHVSTLRHRHHGEGPAPDTLRMFSALPNGSRLSCGRNAHGRKAVEPQIKRLAGEATQLFPTCERPAASSAC